MMYGNDFSAFGQTLSSGLFGGVVGAWIGTLFIPLVIWGLFWKAWALWKAARADSKAWFGILMVINTLGILEIIYIFLISKQARASKKK